MLLFLLRVIIMLTLIRLKAYLKIDYDDEDDDLIELLDSSVAVIASSTGVDVFRIINGGNTDLKALYILIQKKVCKRLYDEQSVSGSILAGLYLKLTTLYKKAVKDGEI